MPQIISSKILAVEVLTHLQDPSDLKKKIDHLHQQSAILLLQGQTLGLCSIGKSGFRFYNPDFGFCNRTGNPKTDRPSSSYDQFHLPNSQSFTHPPHPNSKAWQLRIQINNLLNCTFNKTLKRQILQINPSYAVGNAPICP